MVHSAAFSSTEHAPSAFGTPMQGVIEQITVNNLPIGRSVDEALRLLQ